MVKKITEEFSEFVEKYYGILDPEEVKKVSRGIKYCQEGHGECVKRFYDEHPKIVSMVGRTKDSVRGYQNYLRWIQKQGLFNKKYNRIVQFGSYIGLISSFLAVKYPKKNILGVDFSEEMVKIANKHKEKIKKDRKIELKNLTYFCSDVKDVQVEEGSQDIVLVLQLDEVRFDLAYQHAHRILRKGGILVTSPLNEWQVMVDEKILIDELRMKPINIDGAPWLGFIQFFKKMK